jgi:Flp pilus assembly protein TadD
MLGKKLGREALAHFQQVIQTAPDESQAYFGAGTAWIQLGDVGRATIMFETLVRLAPEWAEPLAKLGVLLSLTAKPQSEQMERAIALGRKAVGRGDANDPGILVMLAAIYAAAGQFEHAVASQQQALALARRRADGPLAEQINKELEFYLRRRALPAQLPAPQP